MNDWYFWFKGEIVQYSTKELHRQTIEKLIGYKFNEVSCAFPDSLHVVVLYNKYESEVRTTLIHKAVELKADCLICKFYYPLYQWQCMTLDELHKHLQYVQHAGINK